MRRGLGTAGTGSSRRPFVLVAAALVLARLLMRTAHAAEPNTSAPAADAQGLADADATGPSEDDGWPDLSTFLDQKFGFLPVAMPITEPAVGYGVAGGLLFISKPLGAAAQGLGRPNISGVGGFATENGSWGVFGADLRYWADDQVQTVFGAVYASVNLDYYGVGKDSALQNSPLRYNLEPFGGAGMARFRIGESRLWAALGYAFATTRVSVDAPDETPALPDFVRRSNVGMLLIGSSLDTRDNFFTPTRGTFVEATFQPAATWLGSDQSFERLYFTAMQYLPLPFRLYLGVRGDAAASFGDAPFYMRPSIALRGVAAKRYQGEETAQLEGELRWQFYGRWSVVGFGGGGIAWNGFEDGSDSQSIFAGGGGLRYELARRYGIHAGIDVASSRDTAAFYIQVGSAWMRP